MLFLMSLVLHFSSFASLNDDQINYINQSDVMGDEHWRERLDRSTVRSEIGTQVASNCLQIFDGEYQDLLADLIEEAAWRVSYECRNEYTELSPYIDEWVSQMRRAFVFCDLNAEPIRDTNEYFEAAHNSPMGRYYFSALNVQNFHDTHESMIYVNPYWFTKEHLTDPQFREELITTLIHEGFHSTHANNRNTQVHNSSLEPLGKEFSCEDPTRVEDRIFMVAGLCASSGQGTIDRLIHMSGSPGYTVVPAYLSYHRMNECGADTCVDMFTQTNEHLDGVRSLGLSVEQAQNVCEKIAYHGQCEAYILNQEETPLPLQSAIDDVKNELMAFMPDTESSFNVYIPRGLQDRFPGLSEFSDMLRADSCMREYVEFDENGNIRISNQKNLGQVTNSNLGYMISHLSRFKQSISEIAENHCPNSQNWISTAAFNPSDSQNTTNGSMDMLWNQVGAAGFRFFDFENLDVASNSMLNRFVSEDSRLNFLSAAIQFVADDQTVCDQAQIDLLSEHLENPLIDLIQDYQGCGESLSHSATESRSRFFDIGYEPVM